MNNMNNVNRTFSRGFTLLELVIAMVIAAILVALALPSFMGSIRKGRRSEAMTALTALQQEAERWRSNNQSYTATLSDLRITTPTSPGGYYTLAISGNSATGYTAIADGSASSQTDDSTCVKMAVKVDRGAITYASCRSCADTDLVFAPSNVCWSK